jgi:hypothetical protein
MLQHSQSHCLTCQRPTLHVRSTYDVPHTAHLLAVAALGLGALVARDLTLTPLLAGAACLWLTIWAAHALLNTVSGGQPFRCHVCGSTPATSAAIADATEAQRLQAAMAKAAAKRAGATR